MCIRDRATTTPLSAEVAEKRLEAAKAKFENGVAIFTDLSEAARKTNEEAFAIIRARFTEGVEEIRDVTESAMKTAA